MVFLLPITARSAVIVDQEQLPEISEAMIYTAMCRLMLRRLARLAQSS